MNVILKDSYKVMRTKEYSIFRDLLGNRDVDERKKKIEKSINEIGYIPVPIVVNEKNEVIDGQGRLAVCKEQCLPVYYMVIPGLGLKECVEMNANSSNWKQKDFIHSFTQLGNNNYIILESFISRYKNDLSLDAITYALCDAVSCRQDIRGGTFKIKQRCMEDADDLCRFVADTTKGIDFPGYKNGLQCALAWCFRNKEIDNEYLKKVVREKAYLFKSYSKIADWLKAIEEIYNFKRGASNRRKIYAMWELSVEEKKRATE